MDRKWYHVCWPRLAAKRVEPVVSISWASCMATLQNSASRLKFGSLSLLLSCYVLPLCVSRPTLCIAIAFCMWVHEMRIQASSAERDSLLLWVVWPLGDAFDAWLTTSWGKANTRCGQATHRGCERRCVTSVRRWRSWAGGEICVLLSRNCMPAVEFLNSKTTCSLKFFSLILQSWTLLSS